MFVTQDWQTLFDGRSTTVFPASESFVAGFVSKQDCDRSYDDWRQGDTEEVWVIFVVDGRYYKKFGSMSSYGDINWNGKCVEVKKVTKTIEVFE